MLFSESPEIVEKQLYKKTLVVALLPIISSLVTGHLDSFLGLIFGLVISFLLLRLKSVNIARSLEMSPAKASTYIRSRYFINYIIYFVVLFVAYRNPRLDFLATALGLLLLKYTIIGLAVIEIVKDKWKKKMKKLSERRVLDESRP